MNTFTQILENNQKLQSRITGSREKLSELRDATNSHTSLNNPKLSVFAAGSLGRLEIGTKSDFDVFMIADTEENKRPSISRLEEYEVFAALININEKLHFPKFSGDGRFLKTYELEDLVKATGSPLDDSENLFTARVLLLLESQSVTNAALYRKAREIVVQHYYRDGLGRDDFRPLFLLNDLLRYWRTLCLNYEVHRNETDRPWLKKNLNLKFSRKLTIFSTVFGLLSGRANDSAGFLQLCELTPIERLAAALESIGDTSLQSGFEKALHDYEYFLQAKEAWRKEQEEDPRLKKRYADAANRFGDFFHSVLESERIDDNLRRYVLI